MRPGAGQERKSPSQLPVPRHTHLEGTPSHPPLTCVPRPHSSHHCSPSSRQLSAQPAPPSAAQQTRWGLGAGSAGPTEEGQQPAPTWKRGSGSSSGSRWSFEGR